MRALVRLVAILVVSVALFSIRFHAIMAYEGRDFSWWTSVYWTLVTMSTLGYGDITFLSDLGRLYSLVVLFAGAILILVMLPFTFIQVVYLPWRAATRRASAPRSLPESTTRPDATNTNIAFTLREVTDRPRVIATAVDADSVDILELAGADRVLQLGQLLGVRSPVGSCPRCTAQGRTSSCPTHQRVRRRCGTRCGGTPRCCSPRA